MPMLSVETRTSVPRKSRSHSSIASHRSSRGERFQRWHSVHTAHSRPLAPSNAKRPPTGKFSIRLFAPSEWLQKMHVEYIER